MIELGLFDIKGHKDRNLSNFETFYSNRGSDCLHLPDGPNTYPPAFPLFALGTPVSNRVQMNVDANIFLLFPVQKAFSPSEHCIWNLVEIQIRG